MSVPVEECFYTRARELTRLPLLLRAGRSDNVVGGDRPLMTDEQSRRVCRKIDRVILPLLMVRLALSV